MLGFILGFPANEIVIPLILMCYLKENSLISLEDAYNLKEILLNHGWTIKTAICVIVFTLCHFPCSTTCLTIKKETGSIKWTLWAIAIPTIVGVILCVIINIFLSNFIKLITLITLIFRSLKLFRKIVTAAKVSRVGVSPQQAMMISGSYPPSLLAHFQIPIP